LNPKAITPPMIAKNSKSGCKLILPESIKGLKRLSNVEINIPHNKNIYIAFSHDSVNPTIIATGSQTPVAPIIGINEAKKIRKEKSTGFGVLNKEKMRKATTA
jgi:uncharacterized membrane protein